MLSNLIPFAILSLRVLTSLVPHPLANPQFYAPKYCTTLTSRTVESAKVVMGWTFPVAGSTCTADLTRGTHPRRKNIHCDLQLTSVVPSTSAPNSPVSSKH